MSLQVWGKSVKGREQKKGEEGGGAIVRFKMTSGKRPRLRFMIRPEKRKGREEEEGKKGEQKSGRRKSFNPRITTRKS